MTVRKWQIMIYTPITMYVEDLHHEIKKILNSYVNK